MHSIFVIIFFAADLVCASYSSRDLRCLVCKRVIQEMEKEISKVNPNKKINLGHRINDEGRVVDKTKPFIRSEMHLSELMDTICSKLENYVRVTHKATGKLDVVQLVTDSGGMNPDVSSYDIIQDSDLNKSLSYYCEGILEEYESQIFDILSEETENPDIKVCTKAALLCDESPSEGRTEL